MLSKQFIFELFFLFLLSGSQAQTEIKGYVLALPGKNPIAFANIGILNASVGTISDQDGSFSLSIASQYFRDSIIFSALGYEPLKIPIRKLIDNRQMTVYLRETAYRLSEVVVMAERGTTKSMSIGNQHFDGSSLYGDTINAGSSMALLIKSINRRGKKNIDFPAYLKEAEVLILNNTFPDFKIRVRVYDVDTIKGKLLPGRDLLEASVVEQSNIKDGWLSFDLSEYRLLVEKDFFIVFEWILEKKDRAAL
ncbi:MAG: carboxypeptidase-like regulatory domain-containing protein [Saprospiraceae bacterium]|nr:carboxypeptidase-like regulatory domain-containing protein [Saprospiraceae bacterium]